MDIKILLNHKLGNSKTLYKLEKSIELKEKNF